MEDWKGEPGAVVRDASAAGAVATGNAKSAGSTRDAESAADTGTYGGQHKGGHNGADVRHIKPCVLLDTDRQHYICVPWNIEGENGLRFQ